MQEEWHPATLSRRGKQWYVVMTVPKVFRAAVGGKAQVRRSTGTSDKTQAAKRKHDLEAELRSDVRTAVRRQRLYDPENPYQMMIEALGLAKRKYPVGFDVEIDDPIFAPLTEPPKSRNEFKEAELQIRRRIHEMEELWFGSTTDKMIELLALFDGKLPPLDEARRVAEMGLQEVEQQIEGKTVQEATILGLLPEYRTYLEQRNSSGTIKHKTIVSRLRNIESFAAAFGDLALREVDASSAYRYAEQLGERYGNKTIKSKITDVRTLLDFAVRKGLLTSNPFASLKLSHYGSATKHYPPIPDELLLDLFSTPDLPEKVRNLWAFAISTGMRIDEIATLTPEQICLSDDGIWFFDLRRAEVKNAAAQRRVPICKTLLPLALKLKSEGAVGESIFGFRKNRDGKTRASVLTQEWMKRSGINSKLDPSVRSYVTHSLRGTFKDKLRDRDVHLEVHNAIMGHDLHTVSASYGDGPSLRILKEAIDRPAHPYLSWI